MKFGASKWNESTNMGLFMTKNIKKSQIAIHWVFICCIFWLHHTTKVLRSALILRHWPQCYIIKFLLIKFSSIMLKIEFPYGTTSERTCTNWVSWVYLVCISIIIYTHIKWPLIKFTIQLAAFDVAIGCLKIIIKLIIYVCFVEERQKLRDMGVYLQDDPETWAMGFWEVRLSYLTVLLVKCFKKLEPH